jgi:hypothetical protein
MLVKKMYGLSGPTDIINFGKVILVEPKKKFLKPIEFFPPKPKPDSNTNESEER